MQRWERLVPNKKVGFFQNVFRQKSVKKMQIFDCNKFAIYIIRWEKSVGLEDIFTRQLVQSFVWTQVELFVFLCNKLITRWWFCTGSGGFGNDAKSKYANLHIYMNFRRHSSAWLISSQMHSGSSWAETEDDLPCTVLLIFDQCEYDEYSSQIIEWELPRRGWEGLNMHHPCVINMYKLQNQLYINWWKRKEMIKGTKYAWFSNPNLEMLE